MLPAGLLGGADNPQLAAMHAAIVDAAAAPRRADAAEAPEGAKQGMPSSSLPH